MRDALVFSAEMSGTLFVIMPYRLHPLFYSPLQNVNFLISAMSLDQSAKWVSALRMGAFATGKRLLSQNLDVMILIEVGAALVGVVVATRRFPISRPTSAADDSGVVPPAT